MELTRDVQEDWIGHVTVLHLIGRLAHQLDVTWCGCHGYQAVCDVRSSAGTAVLLYVWQLQLDVVVLVIVDVVVGLVVLVIVVIVFVVLVVIVIVVVVVVLTTPPTITTIIFPHNIPRDVGRGEGRGGSASEVQWPSFLALHPPIPQTLYCRLAWGNCARDKVQCTALDNLVLSFLINESTWYWILIIFLKRMKQVEWLMCS